MSQPHIILLLALALLAPMAAAGPGVTTSTFESEGPSCSYHHNGTYNDGWDYSYVGGHFCWERFTYARVVASDEDGTLAALQAGGSQGNSSYRAHERHYTPESRTTSDAFSDASAYDRTVGLKTREGDATATTACSSRSSANGFYDARQYDDGFHSMSADHRSHSQDCVRGLTVERDGKTYRAGEDSGCDGQWHRFSESRYAWHYDNETGEYTSSSDHRTHTQGSDGCEGLLAASAGRTGVAAGLRNDCSGSGYYRSHSYDGESYDESYSHRRCDDGVVVYGPEGIAVFGGRQSDSTAWCSSDENGDACSESDFSWGVVRFDWQRNPLGPYSLGTMVPLA